MKRPHQYASYQERETYFVARVRKLWGKRNKSMAARKSLRAALHWLRVARDNEAFRIRGFANDT